MSFSAEGQTERGTEIMRRISQFWYAITIALQINRKHANFLAFWQTVQPISHYGLSGQRRFNCIKPCIYKGQHAACPMLTNISSPNRWIRVRAVYKNIQRGMFGYQRKNEVRNLMEFGENLISNNVCALAWNLLSSQMFEQEIWHERTKQKVLTWKRPPKFYLF